MSSILWEAFAALACVQMRASANGSSFTLAESEVPGLLSTQTHKGISQLGHLSSRIRGQISRTTFLWGWQHRGANEKTHAHTLSDVSITSKTYLTITWLFPSKQPCKDGKC